MSEFLMSAKCYYRNYIFLWFLVLSTNFFITCSGIPVRIVTKIIRLNIQMKFCMQHVLYLENLGWKLG